jgi:hypothetical protein
VSREPLHEQVTQIGFIDNNGHVEVHSSLVSVLLADQPRTEAVAHERTIAKRPASMRHETIHGNIHWEAKL